MREAEKTEVVCHVGKGVCDEGMIVVVIQTRDWKSEREHEASKASVVYNARASIPEDGKRSPQ